MTAGGRMRPLVLAALALVGALAGFQIVRTAAVADWQSRPWLAAAMWPAHPTVLTDRALLSIATAAARGGKAPASARDNARRIAARAPLSPDPYLIEGAIAAAGGKGETVEPLLLAARDRDPRSRGARFLLAERYLRSGRVAAGLTEMQSLVRLQSRGVELFGPALAAYARSPGAVPELRAFFAKYPRAEAGVLAMLSLDPGNAGLVLALASNLRNPEPDWRGTLVGSLAAAGDYERAYTIWSGVSGVRSGRGLFNPAFAKLDAPPPFNWHFPLTTDGIAEPDGKGGLSILHYGRANTVLARQLLLLRPGRYRLAMSVDASEADTGLHWRLRCAPDSILMTDIPVRPGTVIGRFAVPARCDAQWLELESIATENPATTALTIRRLQLAREGDA